VLGLATHEAHFYILREWVPIGRERFAKVCDACAALGHTAVDCPVLSAARAHQSSEQRELEMAALLPSKPLQLLSLPTLREYLLFSLRPEAMAAADAADAAEARAAEWDAERLIDDFVCLTFLVGNDFLPALPTMSIANGGLSVALDCYRAVYPRLSGYLTDGGALQLEPLRQFMRLLSRAESSLLARKALRANARADEARKRRKLSRAVGGVHTDGGGAAPAGDATPLAVGASAGSGGADAAADADGADDADGGAEEGDARAAEPGGAEDDVKARQLAVAAVRDVRGSEGTVDAAAAWRAAEYAAWFDESFDSRARAELCSSYLQGLAWCLSYYYDGCADWRWYLPYHYAPFALDVADSLDAGWRAHPWGAEEALAPLLQLCCVLPPQSAALLPASYGELVNDAAHELGHLFPSTVELDFRGKRHSWQAVVLLPFLPLDEVSAALASLALQPHERRRNVRRDPLAYGVRGAGGLPLQEWKDVRCDEAGLAGSVRRVAEGGGAVEYRPLEPPPPHVARLLAGASVPKAVLSLADHAQGGGVTRSASGWAGPAEQAKKSPEQRKQKRQQRRGAAVPARPAVPAAAAGSGGDAGGLFGFSIV
jgi:5'-3' exoribonuclease 2